MRALAKILVVAMGLGGVLYPAISRAAEPSIQEQVAELMVNPSEYRQGLWPAIKDAVYQGEEQAMDMVYDSSRSSPRLRAIEESGFRYWHQRFVAAVNELRAEREPMLAANVDLNFIDRAPDRLRAFSRRTLPPLISAQAARNMTIEELGLSGVGDIEGYLQTDVSTAHRFHRMIYGLQNFDDFARKGGEAFHFDNWRAEELSKAQKLHENLILLIQRTWLQEFPKKFALGSAIPSGSAQSTTPLIPIDPKSVASFTFLDDVADNKPIRVKDQDGNVKILYRQTAFGISGYQPILAEDAWHRGFFDGGVSTFMDNPSKEKAMLKLEYLLMQKLDAWKYMRSLKNYVGSRDMVSTQRFVDDVVKGSFQHRYDSGVLPEYFRGHFELLYWAGVEAHGSDLSFLAKKEKSAIERGSPVFRAHEIDGFLQASEDKAWRMGTLPPSKHSRATNTADGESQHLFSVHAVAAGDTLPVEFWRQSSIGESREHFKPVELAPVSSLHHIVNSEVPLGLEGRMLNIPRSESFDPVWVEIRSVDGHLYKLGPDFELLHDPGGTFLYANFLKNVPQNVSLRVAFGWKPLDPPKKPLPLDLISMDASVVKSLIQGLRSAKILRTADGLEKLLGMTPASALHVDDVAKVFVDTTLYSYYPEGETARAGASGPFADHSRFLDNNGVPCLQCGGSKDLFADFMNEYFKAKGLSYRAEGKANLIRKGDQLSNPGHIITAIYDETRNEVYSVDTTANRFDSRNFIADATRIAIQKKQEGMTQQKLESELTSLREQMDRAFANRVGVVGANRPGDYVTETNRLLNALRLQVSGAGSRHSWDDQRKVAEGLLAKVDQLEAHIKQNPKVSPGMQKFRLPGAMDALRRSLEFMSAFDPSAYESLVTNRFEAPNCADLTRRAR